MELISKKIGDVYVIYMPPNMDMMTSSSIENELNALINKDPNADMLLNLKDVEEISSSGLRIFLSIRRKLKTNNRILKICEVNNPGVREAFNVTNISEILEIGLTEQESLKSFQKK